MKGSERNEYISYLKYMCPYFLSELKRVINDYLRGNNMTLEDYLNKNPNIKGVIGDYTTLDNRVANFIYIFDENIKQRMKGKCIISSPGSNIFQLSPEGFEQIKRCLAFLNRDKKIVNPSVFTTDFSNKNRRLFIEKFVGNDGNEYYVKSFQSSYEFYVINKMATTPFYSVEGVYGCFFIEKKVEGKPLMELKDAIDPDIAGMLLGKVFTTMHKMGICFNDDIENHFFYNEKDGSLKIIDLGLASTDMADRINDFANILNALVYLFSDINNIISSLNSFLQNYQYAREFIEFILGHINTLYINRLGEIKDSLIGTLDRGYEALSKH